ncbi:MAG: 7-cyano-7-deazaguanine synthase, partial [Nanoarchaeota archaeon]
MVSGGIDSVTSAYIAKKLHRKEVTLLNFDYGQRAAIKEREAVQKVGQHLGCSVVQFDLTILGSWGKSPLTDKTIELPLGMKSVESTLCWTPGRNMLMISFAAAYAESQGIKWLYYGNNMEE